MPPQRAYRNAIRWTQSAWGQARAPACFKKDSSASAPVSKAQRLVSVGVYAWLAGQMGALLAEKRFANADEKGALRMIFDLLKNAGTYQNLPAIYRALQYLQTLDPAALPESRVEIDGGRIFANTVRLTSKPFESCVFEAGWRGSVSRRSVHLRRSSRSARKRTSGSIRGSTIR